jgi:hypothetical protein
MEAYVNDLVIKSARRISSKMWKKHSQIAKLNLTKCSFGVDERMFLGHLITKQMTKANPDKVEEIKKMTSPETKMEVQRSCQSWWRNRCLSSNTQRLHHQGK